MARIRKSYRVIANPMELPVLPEPLGLTVTFDDLPGGRSQAFSFEGFSRFPQMAAEIALGFRIHGIGLSPPTRAGIHHSMLKGWLAFLVDPAAGVHGITSMGELDDAHLRRFIQWLDQRPLALSSRFGRWSATKQILRCLQRHRPDIVGPSLALPFNPFPRRNANARHREGLTQDELDAVLTACRADIDASWRLFQHGLNACATVDRAAIVAAPDLRSLKLRELGVLLTVLRERFGSIIPLQRSMVVHGSDTIRLQLAIAHHGGVDIVARYLHATMHTLIPYMIAIGAQSFANPEALRLLRRDCLTDHPLLDGRVVMTWYKGRATRHQRRSFLKSSSFGVPALIDRMLLLTAPLIPHVPAHERDHLFLVGQVMASRSVTQVPYYLIPKYLVAFVQRHNLVRGDGSPLPLTLSALRVTGLQLSHKALGFNIASTQALANHVSPETTLLYVDAPVQRSARQDVIAKLQARFVEAVRRGELDDRPTLATNLADPSLSMPDATASGFICADPLSGVAPGQRKGRLCTAWLGCFTCPNAVIPLDASSFARLMVMRNALQDARPRMSIERWGVLYAPKLAILENDILPRFPGDIVAAGTRLMETAQPALQLE